MSRRYLACGLCLESEFDLPDLTDAPAGLGADVRVWRERLPSPHGPGLMQQGADTYVRIRDVAYFRVRGGCEIAVDPMAGASDPDIRLALLGPVMGALCYQRGRLPLHAGAVARGGPAAAFAGPSGVGKSTLVAALAALDFGVLCDDTCVLSFDGDGPATAWPGLPRVKLCADAVAELGCGSQDLAFDGRKYALRTPQLAAPRPLARIYLLEDGVPGSRTTITGLAGFVAIKALMANLYRNQYVEPMGLNRQVFDLVTALARSAKVFTVARPRGFGDFDAMVASIAAHLVAPVPLGAPA